MLSWFVEADVAKNTFRNGILIEENEVEVQPEKVPMKCLDEDVSIKVVSSEFYFHKPITVHIELYFFYRFIHFLLYIGQY